MSTFKGLQPSKLQQFFTTLTLPNNLLLVYDDTCSSIPSLDTNYFYSFKSHMHNSLTFMQSETSSMPSYTVSNSR